jgi:hypothetical protein
MGEHVLVHAQVQDNQAQHRRVDAQGPCLGHQIARYVLGLGGRPATTWRYIDDANPDPARATVDSMCSNSLSDKGKPAADDTADASARMARAVPVPPAATTSPTVPRRK